MTVDQRDRSNPWLVLVVLCLGFFMIMLDTTIVNVALPSLAGGLDTSLDQIVWVVNAYLLAYATLLIPAGRLGDLWGPRSLFTAGLVVFTLASAACGLAQTSTELIAARVAQGVGAALLTPQTLTIIATVFPPERRGRAMGVWGSIVGLATVAGPTLGGLMVQVASWRWIFFINLPLGVLALVGTFRYVPDLRPGRKHRFDLIGVALSAAGLFLLVFGLLEGQRYDWGAFWGPITITEVLGLGVALLIALVLWERVPDEPLVPLSLFRTRNYSLMVWINGIIAFGMLSLYLPIVLALQSGAGMSALSVGLTLAPMSVAASAMAPFSGGLADRYGPKYIVTIGLCLFTGGLGLLWVAVANNAGWVGFLVPTVVAGLGLGTSMAPVAGEAMRSVQPQQAGAASGMLNTARQVGGLVGTAVVGAVLQSRIADALVDEANRTAPGLALPQPVRDQFVQAFVDSGAKAGLNVTPGQNGGVKIPSGLTADQVDTFRGAAHDVFVHGLVNAAGPTLAVPIGVVLVGLISSFFTTAKKPAAAAPVVAVQPAAQRASS
ncbi:DHA2 family efflux MFS transporter permease subunit [Kitasatospora sp. NPDC003701]